MLLIDSVLQCDQSQLWAVARLSSDSAFATDDRVSSAVGLEYLAQAAAAFFTLQSTDQAAGARQGMLIACSRLDADIPWFATADGLLMHVRPASRLPTADQGRGLVRFVGDIHVLPQGVPLPAVPPVKGRGVVRAEFSVYL